MNWGRIFEAVHVALLTNLLLAVACAPLVLVVLTTDPGRTWPLLVLFAPLGGPALVAVFAVLRTYSSVFSLSAPVPSTSTSFIASAATASAAAATPTAATASAAASATPTAASASAASAAPTVSSISASASAPSASSGEVFGVFWSAWRGSARRALAAGALATVALLVLGVDAAWLAGRTAGALLLPVVAVVMTLIVITTVLTLVALAERPDARLRDLARIGAYLGLRRWYLSLFSLFVLLLFEVLLAERPAIAIGVAASPLLYIVWANSRFTLTTIGRTT
ncbi:hypothetical protein [Actinoplanes subglobosus]|uniref:Integral membrane protein n=1 Tax=Actinoplanes subglobosus TaxID=1547892 RepID=A0ABV8J8T0_9ACTN